MATLIKGYGIIYKLKDNSLNMHFVPKKNGQQKRWLVFDALNDNVIVGVHEIETLAFLDASKREQDSHH